MLLKTASKRRAQLINAHLSLRGITTHHVYESESLRGQARKPILDTSAMVRKQVGFLRLNREHRGNILTPNYIKNIRRSLDSLNMDEVVKVIYMTGGKGQQFSTGTDFRTILHHKKDGSTEPIAEYLEALYGLQVHTSKINKPILGVAPGSSYNSGATFLQATGFPTVTLDSKMAFNEVTFGFVPHSGASYYLSRLPNEMGTFLALTGLPITGVDAMEVGLAENMVHHSEAYEEDVTEAIMAMEFPVPDGDLLDDRGSLNPWVDQIKERIEGNARMQLNQQHEALRKKLDSVHEEFQEPKDRLPSLTAATDYKYKQLLRQYNERHTEAAIPGYLEGAVDSIYQNYYHHVLGYVKSHSGHNYARNPKALLLKNAQVIARCFYPSSLEEIRDNLQREAADGSSFAALCLDKMEHNSTLSMKLALQLLRDARSLDFKGALQNEVNVALNKINDPEFDIGLQQVLLRPNQERRANPGFRRDVSPQEVKSYFEPNKHANDIKLELVENSLLPTRFYYEKFSDQVRLWLNEDSTPQAEVRSSFEFELKNALQEQGIDIRERALTIESARTAIFNKEKGERQQQVFEERLKSVLGDDKLREGYFAKARQHLEALEYGSAKEFQKLVAANIQRIFEKAYLEKLNTIYERSREAQSLEKRRMFIRFKKFLFQSRLLTYTHEEFDRLAAQVRNLPYKLPHLSERWDGETSFRETAHPEIGQSFLTLLSAAIGKRSLAVPELAKAYVSDRSGELVRYLSLYTFDKEELLRLRADILAQPEKYERMLTLQDLRKTRQAATPNDKPNVIRRKKHDEYDYWYRVLNEGRLPTIDALPYYRQLVAYHDFVEQVETRAFNTLKLTVQRLINDFESVQQQFSQKEKETKHQALSRLLSLLSSEGSTETVAKDLSTTAAGGKTVHLTQSARSTKDIKRLVNQLLDQGISKLLPSATDRLGSKLREDLMGELYQLIEFVLLNNATQGRSGSALPPKHLLQERLASLTNAQQAVGSPNVTNLRVLDTFLNERNSSDLVKDAIKLAKPYFFLNIVGPRIEAEARKVFDAFRAESTGNEVLHYYFMFRDYPELLRAEPTNPLYLLKNFSEDREREKYLDIAFPSMSIKYAIKSFTSLMGQAPTLSAADLEAYTKNEYEFLEKLKAVQRVKEEAFDKQAARADEESLNRHYNFNDPDKEVEGDPALRPHVYDFIELDRIMEYATRAEQLQDWLDSNHQNIRHGLTNTDWLHIYAQAIKSYGLDMRQVFRSNIEGECSESHQVHLERLEKEMHAVFEGKQVTFAEVADYAQFLSELYDIGALAQKEVNIADYEQMTDYMVRQMEIVDGEDLLRSQSLYEMIKHTKQRVGRVNESSDSLREQVRSFAQLQEKLNREKRTRANIEALAVKAPKEAREFIEQALNSQSQYLNLAEVERLLQEGNYSKLTHAGGNLINRERLFSDLRTSAGSEKFKNFLKTYFRTPLDVVSLAEARETVANAPTSTLFDEKLQNQIKTVLDFAEESLRTVPHSRREKITLGDYLQRHNYITSKSNGSQDYLPDLLKRRLSELIGQTLDPNGENTIVDWEFAGVKTNPETHLQEDARIKSALAKGKGFNAEGTTEIILDSQQKGRGAAELGESPLVEYIDPITGEMEAGESSTVAIQEILRDARELTKLSPESVFTRNYYENMLMEAYVKSVDYDQAKIEGIVQQYTDIRLRECLLKEEFAKKARSNNGHYYLKMLREQITEELNIANPSKPSDLAFKQFFERQLNLQGSEVDVQGRYNTQQVSGQNQVGLGSLVGEDQSSTLDKLLQDYFLQKRGQYKASNQLLDQLNQQFGLASADYKDGDKNKTGDKFARNNDRYPFGETPNLAFAHLVQGVDKFEYAALHAGDYNDMLNLDIATQQVLKGGKSGLSDELAEFKDLNFDIPEYFNLFDVRKPPQKYVEDKLESVLSEIFEVRRQVEKTMNRNELLAYDRVLEQHLTKETLLPRLKGAIELQRNELQQVKQLTEMNEEGQLNTETQFKKTPNRQAEHNRDVKNEDALYKFLAYSGMLEKSRREDLKKTRKDIMISTGVMTFPEFYKKELQKDAKREPRTINPADYQQRRGLVDADKAEEGFKTIAEREQEYFKEYELYKENKKEQLDRNQLFFVLEQFFSHTKANPDPLNKAQQAINEYFKDTENTFFFDKNKIQ